MRTRRGLLCALPYVGLAQPVSQLRQAIQLLLKLIGQPGRDQVAVHHAISYAAPSLNVFFVNGATVH